MTRKTYTNDVLAGNANGGLHSARKLGTLRQFMTTHDLKKALLYQFILSGSPSKLEYQATIKALIRHIRTKCRAEYIGGYEVGDEKGGLHCHCYILIESAHHFPSDLLDVREGKFIARRIKRTGMSIRIAPPQNRMHGGEMYARMNTPEKLADCIKWSTYFLKVRSKDDVPGREVYFGSEFASNIAKRETQRQKHRDALTICRPTPAPTKEEPMTPAEIYVATHYEAAVDAGLDLDALRLHLLAHGIKRTPAQVLHDLDETYGFHGYASRNPAPPKPDLAKLDALIDRTPLKDLAALKVGVYNCLTDVRQSYTPRPTI